jgi:hypothetical protein
MKVYLLSKSFSYLNYILLISLISCTQDSTKTPSNGSPESIDTPNFIVSQKEISQEFKDYWYGGEAEITSFSIEQARYGELRAGTAVLIYVTEDFRPELQVKADGSNSNNVSVIKLNSTKNFNTGIYPYSVMQSTFYPVTNDQHAIKLTCSIQEWCGQVYTQLNNRSTFEVSSFSYFESESDKNFSLEKHVLENELWTQLRIDPSSLPQGIIQIIPSLEFTRFKHLEVKAYNATATLSNGSYHLNYPELDRSITINFNSNFPHEILGWQETFNSGFGPNEKSLTTKATRLKSIKSAYWEKNSNADEYLRETLELQ